MDFLPICSCLSAKGPEISGLKGAVLVCWLLLLGAEAQDAEFRASALTAVGSRAIAALRRVFFKVA